MNTEFKTKNYKDATVYVLENASGGSTSAGSVATVSKPLGKDQLVMQSRMGPKEAPKPRNFVAKNAKMGGAGQHKDKKKAEKQGDVKHRKPFAEGDYNHGFADPNAPQLGQGDAFRNRERNAGLEHEQNNIQISINGKTWKVIPGKGYADSREERKYLDNMKTWAEKKSAATGKKWTVSLTGANSTEGVAEGGVLKSIKRGMQGWGRDELPITGTANKPKDVVARTKSYDIDTAKMLRKGLDDAPEHTPAGLQKRVLDRKLKGVAEGIKGAIAGGAAGALLTRTPSGAMTGADIGNTLGDMTDENYDEAETMKNSLHTIIRMATELDKHIDDSSEFDEWVSEKMGAVKGMLTAVADYVISDQEMGSHEEETDEEIAPGIVHQHQHGTLKHTSTAMEGAKVDRQAKHITKSMMKSHPGMSKDNAESAAWAHIKHPKKKKKVKEDAYNIYLEVLLNKSLNK